MADESLTVPDPLGPTLDEGTGQDVVMVGTGNLDVDYGEYKLCMIAIK